MKILLGLIFVFLFSLASFSYLHAQELTVGVGINEEEAFEGYTLFSPLAVSETYLIDNCGFLVKSWQHSENPSFGTNLLSDGNLLRAGDPVDPNVTANVVGGFLELISWENELLWSYEFNTNIRLQHHDLIQLLNKNILVLAWEQNTPEEQILLGRDTSNLVFPFLWTETLYEVKPIGSDDIEIVWEWHSNDHLIQEVNSAASNFGDIANHPERIDINYVGTFFMGRARLVACKCY